MAEETTTNGAGEEPKSAEDQKQEQLEYLRPLLLEAHKSGVCAFSDEQLAGFVALGGNSIYMAGIFDGAQVIADDAAAPNASRKQKQCMENNAAAKKDVEEVWIKLINDRLGS